MRDRSRPTLPILLLLLLAWALPGCAREPRATGTSQSGSERAGAALGSAQETAYRQDLARLFADGTTDGAVSPNGVTAARATRAVSVAMARVAPSGAVETAVVDSEEQAIRFLRGDRAARGRAAEME